jgi:uncharacterized protein (TIGR00255 family)
MTGFGEALLERDSLAVRVELRSVNNRFFKMSIRSSDGYGSLESKIEKRLKEILRRGSVSVQLRVTRARTADDFGLNIEALSGFRKSLLAWAERDGVALCDENFPFNALIRLPGVVDDSSREEIDLEADWPLIEEAFEAALENIQQMRLEEGAAMAKDLLANVKIAGEHLTKIELRAPEIVQQYRAKLLERVQRNIADVNIQVEPRDVIKEVGLFADRADISEEIVRLRNHLEQFEKDINSKTSEGKKLDFLTQEMFRETNTIGSKANDYEVTGQVIEIKAAVERIREMVQNIE